MTLQAFYVASLFMLALAIGLLDWLEFLAPYKRLIVTVYGVPIGLFLAALYVNVFAAIYFATRRLFLKDTGRKLAHLERQLESDPALARDLSRHLRD